MAVHTLSYRWFFENNEYEICLDFDYSEYLESFNKKVNRRPENTSDRASLVDYRSNTIKKLSEKLKQLSSGMNAVERANFVLRFVQYCFHYEKDVKRYGLGDYWKYPVETLFERRGDCEDTSILYCALMKALGEDVALLLSSDHCAAGIAIPGADGKCVEHDDKKYYFCETTSNHWIVGDFEGFINYDVVPIP